MNKYAAIDIGTNTILMVIGGIDSNNKLVIYEDVHEIARLGEGLNANGFINHTAIDRAKVILSNYSYIIDKYDIKALSIKATSAMRKASNSEYVKGILSSAINGPIEVISGSDEARLTLIGSIRSNENATIIDIGGGSTEITSGDVNNINALKSIDIGAVYINEYFTLSESNKDLKYKVIKEYIYNILLNEQPNELTNNIIAVAGTPTTLASIHLGLKDFQPEKIDGYILSFEIIAQLTQKLFSMSTEDIVNEFSVHPMRADVIASGALILQEFLRINNLPSCRVSVRGIRYGALKELISREESIPLNKIE